MTTRTPWAVGPGVEVSFALSARGCVDLRGEAREGDSGVATTAQSALVRLNHSRDVPCGWVRKG